eukprot:705459-Pelagomonas_calceolata.AAC.1
MGMKLASKFNGTLMVKSTWTFELFGLIKVCRGLHAAAVHMCRLQLLFRSRVLTELNFIQVHMSLVSFQLVRLSHTVSCAGLLEAGGARSVGCHACCVTHGGPYTNACLDTDLFGLGLDLDLLVCVVGPCLSGQ